MGGLELACTPSDLELLFEQVKKTPYDDTLLGAYADCLDEHRQHKRAEAVRSFRRLQRIANNTAFGTVYPLTDWLQSLSFLLRLERIYAGSIVKCNAEGYIVPETIGTLEQMSVGVAVASAWSGQMVQVQLFENITPGLPPYNPTIELETAFIKED